MKQPEGYEEGDQVCRLKKSLYGLKQASRVWNTCFTSFPKEFKLQPSVKDGCLLFRETENDILIILIYVDDGLVCCNNKQLMNDVIDHLRKKFEITVMDPNCFVGLQITRDRPNKICLLYTSPSPRD